MVARRRLTLEEFLARPETKPASEYACGETWKKPLPTRPHGLLQMFLGALLMRFVLRHDLGKVGSEVRTIFGAPSRKRTYVPDITFVTKARLGTALYHLVAPDLIVEILSPNERPGRFADTLAFYLANGVRLVWVVGMRDRTIRAYVPGQDSVLLRDGDILEGGDVLPGFAVPVSDIFDLRLPS